VLSSSVHENFNNCTSRVTSPVIPTIAWPAAASVEPRRAAHAVSAVLSLEITRPVARRTLLLLRMLTLLVSAAEHHARPRRPHHRRLPHATAPSPTGPAHHPTGPRTEPPAPRDAVVVCGRGRAGRAARLLPSNPLLAHVFAKLGRHGVECALHLGRVHPDHARGAWSDNLRLGHGRGSWHAAHGHGPDLLLEFLAVNSCVLDNLQHLVPRAEQEVHALVFQEAAIE
jgi:hypothetical protein